MVMEMKHKSDILFKQLPFDSCFKSEYKEAIDLIEEDRHLAAIITLWYNIKNDLYTRMDPYARAMS